MIRDVDESLRAWLVTLLPGVTVSFDPPRPVPSPDGTSVLRLYLADLREEDDQTTDAWIDVRDDDGVVVGRQPAGRRYRFAYLLMAEAVDTLTEHALLGELLQSTRLSPVLPGEHLCGDLARDRAQVVLRFAPERRFTDPTHLWQAWGVPPRLVMELWLLAAIPAFSLAGVASPPGEISLGTRRSVSRDGALRAPADGTRRPRARIEED